MVTVFPKFETKNVQVFGDTAKKQLPASLPAKFQIDTKKAGKADINVAIKVSLKMVSIFAIYKWLVMRKLYMLLFLYV